MNLTQFMKKTDANLRRMSQEEMADFIRNLARTLPESERGRFLVDMAAKPTGDFPNPPFTNKCDEVIERLRQIKNGEICLVGALNEMYDDWYASDEDEFIYEDPQGIGYTLNHAYELVRVCIENRNYQTAYEMTQLMIGMEISIEGEYLEYADEPMTIDEMAYKDLTMMNYEQLLTDGLYAAYRVCEAEQRPEALYGIFCQAGAGKISLERVLQDGEELPDMDDFLYRWVAYLGNQKGYRAQQLLQEAVELSDDSELFLENARTYCKQHPGLYEQYLRTRIGKADVAELLAVGDEALNAIDVKYLVRGRIALSLCSLQSDQDRTEHYWLEAYRSNTRVENFLRLYLESRDAAPYLHDIKEIYRQAQKMAQDYIPVLFEEEELQENAQGMQTVQMIGFLSGEFRKTREQDMNLQKALGWSFSFMKCGLAAFLLLFLDDQKLGRGCAEMCNIIVRTIHFDSRLYCQGTALTASGSEADFFWNCFTRWKAAVKIPHGEQLDYLVWMEQLIWKRVDGIMTANKRNYYDECAAFAAALGEVIESRGEKGGKQRIMQEFMQEYARRSAFRKSMKSFGMLA